MSFETSNEIREHMRRALGLPLSNNSNLNNDALTESPDAPVAHERTTNDNDAWTESPDGPVAHEGEADSNTDIEENNRAESPANEAEPHPLFSRGTDVYEDSQFIVRVKAVAHRKRTRYSLSDHLFDVKIIPKDAKTIPLVIDLEDAIAKGLILILEKLQKVYDSRLHQNQIYVTVIEKHILNGLNSGNYSLHTPSAKIARWILAMLYNYLKSNQTLKLNESFKIQIKVLSRRHTDDLVARRPGFRIHTYH